MWKNRLLSAVVFPAPAFLDQLDQVMAVPHQSDKVTKPQIKVAKVLKKPTTVFDNLTARLLYPHRRRSGRLATTPFCLHRHLQYRCHAESIQRSLRCSNVLSAVQPSNQLKNSQPPCVKWIETFKVKSNRIRLQVQQQ